MHPPTAVIVSDNSHASDDPYDLIYSNITFVNALFGEHFRDDEIAPRSMLSYWVDYFLSQLKNGGFSQFVYNSRWNPKIVQAVRDGLSVMEATEYLAVFEQGARQVAAMSSDRLAAYFAAEYFGDNAERDELDALTATFLAVGEREDLVALNSAWIRSLPDLTVLSIESMSAEIDRRVGQLTDRDERVAASRAAEPAYKKRIRALCDAAGHVLSDVTAGDPSHEHEGRRVLAWHFFTDRGHHYMIEDEAQAIMYEAESNSEVARLDLPR